MSGSSWRSVLGRAWHLLMPHAPDRRSRWWFGVPVIVAAAGLLFTTSASTAEGGPLREDRRLDLTDLIEEREQRVADAEAELEPLAEDVSRLTGLRGSSEGVEAEQDRADALQQPEGFTALHGPGLTVTLNDALRPDGLAPRGSQPDDLLVHQQDVQAVVNALWAGGAEAMAVMGERIISTSAVICVGPVLLLHGRPYSPPYVITAIGDSDALRAALAESPGVQLFREAVDAYGLGYQETVEEDVTLPGYDGTSTLRFGQVAPGFEEEPR